MKLSVSLTDEDVALVDDYLSRSGLKSRSAVIRRALRLLRQPDLEGDYAAAWAEWAASGEQEAWESTTADGVAGASR
jgi:Arc/MetJ-type ribon-helix-helix transcriptional regulator